MSRVPSARAPKRRERDAPAPERAVRAERIGAALRDWFEAHRRDLPWRNLAKPSPYHVWLSEVMLQQTRVDTVIPYFERFLARFPTLQTLADADLDDVLTLWAGLGYYSRGRALHRAAQAMAREHGGAVPSTIEALRALPGIGPYTAGAIASIAFDAPAATVDGNVTRVLARLRGIAIDARSPEGNAAIWGEAEDFMKRIAKDGQRPSVHNQALMELGALVCTPKSPSCGACPVADACVARRTDRVAELPVLGPRARPKSVDLAAFLVTEGGRVLLARRRPEGLFGGLWEPPIAEVAGGDLEGVRRAAASFGLDPSSLRAIGAPVKHALTHRALSVSVFGAAPPDRSPRGAPEGSPYDRMGWSEFEPSDAAVDPTTKTAPRSGNVALSTLARKILALAATARTR